MKKVAIYKIYCRDDCPEYCSHSEFLRISDFEDISDDDFNLFERVLGRQGANPYPEYVMIEKSNTSELKENFASVIEKMKMVDKKIEEENRKMAAREAKRQKSIERKREEKERALLEKLKEKFGERNVELRD